MVLLVNGEPIKQLGAGVRKKPPASIPQFNEVGYWFDGTDQSVVFQDTAGTIPIVDFAVIKNILNKGYVPIDMNSSATLVRWKVAGGINGLPHIEGGSFAPRTPSPSIHPGAGPNGASFFGVGRHESGVSNAGQLGLNWLDGQPPFGSANFQTVTTGGIFIRGQLMNGAFITLKAGAADTLWYWVWGTVDSAGNYRMQVAGEAEVSGTGTYAPIGTDVIMGISGINTRAAEGIIWPDYVLTNNDIADLIAYSDTKYGVLPAA